jgi:hypothetical protein
MKRMGWIAGMFAVVAMVSTAAWACDKDKAGATATVASGEAKGGCCKKAQQSGDTVDAAVNRVVAELPKMTYRVGEFETNCPHAAQAKSEETKTPVSYVVAGETFGCKVAATNKLAELWNAKLPEVTQVAYRVNDETMHCPKAAAAAAEAKHAKVQPVVAGVDFDCPEKAQAVADRLAAKMKEFGATTASASAGEAKTGGCGKHAEEAKTASAEATTKSEVTTVKAGCCKGKAAAAAAAGQTASTGGCGKHAEEAKTASAEVAAKTEGATKAGCCKGNCMMADGEDTPAMASAKKMVRQVVEFVVAQQTVETQPTG